MTPLMIHASWSPRVLAVCSWWALLLLPVCVLGEDGAEARSAPRFNRDIRPLLSNVCFQCHGPDEKKREGGLRLDVRDGALAVQESGRAAIVPGRPDESELMKRLRSHDADEVMPPPKSKRPPFSEQDIATLSAWIAAGAEYEGHWAFQPIARPVPPAVQDPGWVRNEIDRFILARLEADGITPSPEADPTTLARRLSLDLTGLPAEPAGDVPPPMDDAAYRRRVDTLLDSPHYGERWGRHWLDQARYADSNGYAIDGDRVMWPYRDWVIDALNRDLPFDRFTIEQLAGDLLPDATKAQRAATAFHRNTLINEEGGTDAEQFRVESVNDRVHTTGAAWLGLTLGCAQCHTHKYDPITHRDYYRFFAFFNSTADRNDTGPTVPVRRGEFFRNDGAQPARPAAAEAPPTGGRAKPAALMVMSDLARPRPTYLLQRGDFTRPDSAAGPLRPGIPNVFGGPLAEDRTPVPPTRLELARWIVSHDNPLTARVTVNRVWMRYFGRGLVETEEDFGTQGTAPSHPELLDWLASEFVRGGWSMKALHRLIVTSATYRQSSRTRLELEEKDPRNLLLARQSRLRLEAEIIRDIALAASGLLDRTLGGPSVRPPQPEGVYAFTQQEKKWETSTGGDRYRRGMYTFFYRSAPHPLFGTFDAPDFQVICTRRPRSNTPLQSLALANDPAFLECAQALAARLVRECPGDFADSLEARLDLAFQLSIQRPPTRAEIDLLKAHVQRQHQRFLNSPGEGAALGATAETASLVSAARVLFNLDSFITRE
jgi:mono/diheme cytochrome c family protein